MAYPNNTQPYDGKNQQGKPTQVAAMKPISYVVRLIQNELEDYTENKYKRLLQIVINGVGQMRLFHKTSIDVLYSTPNDAGIIELPRDYLDYTKIGVVINGLVYNLTVNNNIALNRAQKCGVDVRQISAGISLPDLGGYFYTPHYRNGVYVGALYGVGGGFNFAYYRVDEKQGQIEFDGNIQGREVVIEYKSTGIGPGSIVFPEEIEVLKRWGLWRNVVNDLRVAANHKKMLKDDYDESIMELRSFVSDINIQEYLDSMYASRKQGPKW
jgi:hypothetical protein